MTRLSLFVIVVFVLAAGAASAATPATGTITPSTGTLYTGQKLQLVTTFSDQDGAADIVESRILLNTALVSGNGVFLRIDLAADLIYLRNDANTQWLGGYAAGSQNTVSNSQGIVYCADSSIQRAGDVVTVTISMELKPAVAGKTLYQWLYARDALGASDGWDQAGSVAAALPPPTNVSVSPSAGDVVAGEITVTTVQSEAEGYSALKGSYIVINTTLSSKNAISLYYDPVANKLYLRNDDNTAWLGGFAPGAAASVANSQARLRGAATTVSGNGNNLTINWALTVNRAMKGKTCGIWMYAVNTGNRNTGYENKGQIRFVNAAPSTGSLDPSGSSALVAGARVTLSSSYSDGNGYGDITGAYLVLNGTLSSKDAISLWYDAVNNKLYLRNDANTAWLGGFAPGAESSLIENSLCKVDCFQTTVNGVGNALLVNWRIEPKAPAAGRELKSWLYAMDASGAADGWDQAATYIAGAPDMNVSLVPINANITSGRSFYVTTISHAPNGQDSTSSYVLLNSSQGPANGIYLWYDGAADKMWLRNDAGTTWTGGFTPGSINTLENSYVSVNVGSSRAEMFGSDLEVRWLVQFKPAAEGRTLYSWTYTSDSQGLKDGWDLKGTIRPVAAGGGPENLGIAPVGGPAPLNLTLALSTGYAYSDGVTNIVGCYLLMNSTLDANQCAYFYYDATNNKLWLRNDAGTAWLGGYAPGTENIIENSYVKLFCSTTTVTTTPTVNVEWSFSLKTTLAGRRLRTWMYVIDNQGKTDGWDQFGEFQAERITPALINTSRGQIALNLYDDEAPLTVGNFKRLANLGFFNGLNIHRVEAYVIQGGDGEPEGRLATSIPLEESLYRTWTNVGQIGMARTSYIHSADSQFFINKQPQPGWDPTQSTYGYALFGAVTSGMDVVNATQVGDVINSVVILP